MLFLCRNDDALQSESFLQELKGFLTHTFVSLQQDFSNMVVSSRHVVKHLRQIETLHSSPKTLCTRNNNKQKAHKKNYYTPLLQNCKEKKNITQKTYLQRQFLSSKKRAA